MKFTKYIFTAALLALLAGADTSPAATLPDPVNGFAAGSTNAATTLSYAIVSPRGTQAGAAPRVQYLNATSDKAASKVQFYLVTAETAARYATNATVTLHVNSTNGFASGDVIIIRHVTDDSYEKRTLTTMTSATNLTTTAAPLGAVVPGDKIYRCTTTGAGSIPVGSATLTLGPTAGAIYIGQKDKPLLVEIDATTSGTLNVVAGDYIR